MAYYALAAVIVVAAALLAAARPRRRPIDIVSTELLTRLRAADRSSA